MRTTRIFHPTHSRRRCSFSHRATLTAGAGNFFLSPGFRHVPHSAKFYKSLECPSFAKCRTSSFWSGNILFQPAFSSQIPLEKNILEIVRFGFFYIIFLSNMDAKFNKSSRCKVYARSFAKSHTSLLFCPPGNMSPKNDARLGLAGQHGP